jgi:hypothetical protein
VSSPLTRPSPLVTLAQLPPYVFAALDSLKAEARAAGRTFVDLGIGSPDQPTPPAVVEALGAAVREARWGGYPPFRGAPEYLAAAARFMQARFGAALDARREVVAVSGSKEGLAHLLGAYLGPGDVALVPAIHYPVYARAPLMYGAEVHLLPDAGADVPSGPRRRSPPRCSRGRARSSSTTRTTPRARRATAPFLARCVDFARDHGLLLVSDLAYSELTYAAGRGAERVRGRRGARRGRRAALVLEVVQHGRAAHRLRRGARGRDGGAARLPLERGLRHALGGAGRRRGRVRRRGRAHAADRRRVPGAP